MRKTAIFVLLVLLAMLAIPAASAATMTVVADPPQVFSCDPVPIPITVNVTNTSVGTPIDGANVTFRGTWWSTNDTTTNGECTFYIHTPYDENGKFWVDVNATGYDDVIGMEIPIYPYNGYKGKSHTCGPNMTTWKTYDLNGNLLYSVGDSQYVSGSSNWTWMNVTWTANNLPVPGDSDTIKEARLYAVYTWDKHNVMPNNVSMSFNSADQEPEEAHYWDKKGYGGASGEYLYGMLTYNVTDDFDASGNYANLRKSVNTTQVSMRGMLLVVIYENASEPRRLIYVNEEFDMLCGHIGYYGITPEEATAWAPITGSIDTSLIVANATLITVAPGAGDPLDEGELIFNGQIWNDVWNFAGSSQIGIDERDVASYLESTDNEVGFQSSADWMEASNAILVVEVKTPNATVFFEPSDSGADHGNTTTVGVWVNTSKALTGGNLHFDYTFCCANVTDYTPNITNWEFAHIADMSVPGHVSIGFGTLDVAGRGPGLLHIGDLDIHCCNESYCKTGLIWDISTSTLSRLEGGIVDPVKWDDGTFTCTNLPDLDITEVYGEQQTGDDYIIHYTVKNIGNADASAGHTTTLHIGELATPGTWTWIEDMTVPNALAPGASYEGTFNTTLTMTIPNDLMKVCADTGGNVMEIDEDNNCMESFYPAGIEIRVVAPDGCVDFQEQFTVDIDIDPRNIATYGVQYTLSFNNEVLHCEWQNEGTFLSGLDDADTNVYINTIDNGAGTVSFAATRTDTPDGVVDNGTLATIKFTAIQQGADTNLNLSDIVVSNNLGNEILPVDDINGSVCVWENIAPVANGKSMHKYNNDGQKYICKVYFNGTLSDDEDGAIVYWRWGFGDGNYGTGELKDHIYQSWNWNTLTGEYDPFVASLTVTDDGDPHQLDNTTYFDVIVYTAGDANGDGKVNILDATIVGLEWNEPTTCGAYCWEGNERADRADLNNDCKVNILDAVIIGTCWGHTAW